MKAAIWVSKHLAVPVCLPGCAQSQETDDVITLVLSTVIGRKDNNDTIMCVFLPSGLSMVKRAGLLPHTYTQTCVPVRSKVSILRARIDYFNTHTYTPIHVVGGLSGKVELSSPAELICSRATLQTPCRH